MGIRWDTRRWVDSKRHAAFALLGLPDGAPGSAYSGVLGMSLNQPGQEGAGPFTLPELDIAVRHLDFGMEDLIAFWI